MNNLFIELKNLLEEKKIHHYAIEEGKGFNNPIRGHILSQGYRLTCYGNFQIRSIKGNNLIDTGPLITAEDVFNYITKGIYSNSPYKLIFNYLNERNIAYIQKLPNVLRTRIKSRRHKLIPVVKEFIKKKITIEQAVVQIESIMMQEKKVTGNGKSGKDALLLGIIPAIKTEVVLEIPIRKEMKLGNTVTLENLIIFDSLVTFPYLINEVLKWNKNGGSLLSVQNYLDRKYSAPHKKKVKSIPLGWIYAINHSHVKDLIYRNILDYVCLDRRWESIQTNNPSIWKQALLAYRVIRFDANKDQVPTQFLKNLEKLDIYVNNF